MIKTSLGAQRYNNRMDKIFENAKIQKEKTKKLYQEVYNYLMTINQDFCFTEWHGIVTREDCRTYLLLEA